MTECLFGLVKQGATVRQLQLVLESETTLECRNERQETPLMAAMLNIHDPTKREKTLLLFIEYNANVNCINMRGQTPLMYACILNLTLEMRILLNEPVLDCNMRDFEGNTALMYACALGKTEAIETLVNASCAGQIKLDPYIMNVEGTSAFDYARDNQDETILKMISRLITEDSVYNYDQEPKDPHKSKSKARGKHKKVKGIKTKRICQLAVDVRNEDSSAKNLTEKKVVVWKEGQNGKPDVAFDVNGDAEVEDTAEISKTNVTVSESKIPKKKSVIMNIHLPKTYNEEEDYSHETLQTNPVFGTDRASSSKSAKIVIDDQVPSTSGVAPIPTTMPKNKQRKRKGKRTRKKKRIQTANSKTMDLGLVNHKPKNFGEEIVFCNKIYGADLYPCSGGPDDCHGDMDKVIAKIKRKITGYMQPTSYTDDWERSSKQKKTGKMDCLKLSAAERARILSRTIWSVYGAPLPPIPITVETVQRVMSGITTLRQYLGKAKYQPGRLLSLDPEMWCIIQSIKHESSQRDQNIFHL